MIEIKRHDKNNEEEKSFLVKSERVMNKYLKSKFKSFREQVAYHGMCQVYLDWISNCRDEQLVHEYSFIAYDTNPIGMVNALVHKDDPTTLYITTFVVLKPNNKIGSKLLSYIKEFAKPYFSHIRLTVLWVNKNAERFYRKHGFKDVKDTDTSLGYELICDL